MTTRLKPLLILATLTLLALPGIAQAAGCPNEEFRTGPSASLPDCRAYELVTPEELGRTQAITFTEDDHAIPSIDGESLALETLAPLEPNPNTAGTRAIFSRTAQGWRAKSLVPPEFGGRELDIVREGILSPELSQVAFTSEAPLNQEERAHAPVLYEAGPVGGPYALVAEAPLSAGGVVFADANAGTASVPAFTDVLLESEDHQLLPEGSERTIAEETLPGAYTKGYNLYDWTAGTLRLVNVEGQGADVKALGSCGGGELGGGVAFNANSPSAVGAVSADGSKVFFTSCGRLYMRVENRETIEISAPAPGVELSSSERSGVAYNAANTDGSEVVFNTATPLLPNETVNGNKLFIYNTVTRDLRLIGEGLTAGTVGTGYRSVLLSEDGSAVYYTVGASIYRYETQTGKTSFVATTSTPAKGDEPSYTTPNGRFLVFVSGPGGVEVTGPGGHPELESRGVGHNELYRYDAADGSVMCVSCGQSVAPAAGDVRSSEADTGFELSDETPPLVQMSEDGQKVFFQTTAQLVPQDTNSTQEEGDSAGGLPGMDVYEWEADGAEEGEGTDVFCRVADGCTHLISTGEDVGQATFLGASENGSNLFFATAGRLVPQATPEFPNIYDARVDGGFAPPREARPCLSCQGVGSTAPLFGPGASLTFTGPGNPAALASMTSTIVATKKVKCGKGYLRRKGGCVKAKRRRKAKRASRRVGL